MLAISAFDLPHACALRDDPRTYVASYRELEKIFFSISVLSNIFFTFSSLEDPTSQVHWPGKWCSIRVLAASATNGSISMWGPCSGQCCDRKGKEKPQELMPILFPSPGVNFLQQFACSCLQFPESCFWYFLESLAGISGREKLCWACSTLECPYGKIGFEPQIVQPFSLCITLPLIHTLLST